MEELGLLHQRLLQNTSGSDLFATGIKRKQNKLLFVFTSFYISLPNRKVAGDQVWKTVAHLTKNEIIEVFAEHPNRFNIGGEVAKSQVLYNCPHLC